MITIQVIDDFEELAPFRPAWESLLMKSLSRSVFLTWEWVETWWNCYQAGFELLVMVAREDGIPCGIAPLIVRKGATPRLEFFGQNKAYGEYLDFLVAQDDETRVTPEICGKIAELYHRGMWQCMSLAVVLEASPNLDLIRRSLQSQGLSVTCSQRRVSPYIELPASWPEYLDLKGKKLSKRIDYNSRRLSKLGAVVVEFPENLRDVDEYLDDLIALHCDRWQTAPDKAFFTFHREIAHKFYRLDRLLLARMKVGDRVVAAKYDFVFDKKVWGYQGGWLREFERFEVGSVLLCELFKYCIERGLRAYDFLEGNDWYKTRWSTHSLTSVDLEYGQAGSPFVF